MAIHRSFNIFHVVAFVVLLAFSTPCSLLAQRRCCEGDTWMKWTADHRKDYVLGYILGRAEGYSDACYRLVKYWPSQVKLNDEKNPLTKCLKEMPDFSRGPEYFAQQVTELYTTYPEDRILLITEILEALGSGKSIQDLHQHPPFPTTSSARGDASRHPAEVAKKK